MKFFTPWYLSIRYLLLHIATSILFAIDSSLSDLHNSSESSKQVHTKCGKPLQYIPFISFKFTFKFHLLKIYSFRPQLHMIIILTWLHISLQIYLLLLNLKRWYEQRFDRWYEQRFDRKVSGTCTEVELAQKCKRGRKTLGITVDPPGIIMIDFTDFDEDEVDKMKPTNTKDNFKCQLCEAVFLDIRALVIYQTKHRLDITASTCIAYNYLDLAMTS